jgi:exodeoxyribonuclease VII small subunit
MSEPTESTGARLAEDLKRLEEIVRLLESDEPELDDALALFEEGVARLRQAREQLAQAELTVQRVLAEADGTIRVEDVDEQAGR